MRDGPALLVIVDATHFSPQPRRMSYRRSSYRRPKLFEGSESSFIAVHAHDGTSMQTHARFARCKSKVTRIHFEMWIYPKN